MKIRELSIQSIPNHPHRKAFNIGAWCMNELYWYGLKDFKEAPFAKMVITLGTDRPQEQFGNVYKVYQAFDFDHYFGLSKSEKKRVLIDLLHQEMVNAFEAAGLDTALLQTNYQACLDRQLVNQWLLKDKYFSSKNRQFKAGVECLWEMDTFTATGILTNAKGEEQHRQLLVEVEPHMAEFIYYAKCGWQDTTFYLESKSGDRWSMHLP